MKRPSSPFAAERLVRLHRLLLRLKAEVLDVDAEVVVENLEDGVGQSVLLFVCEWRRKGQAGVTSGTSAFGAPLTGIG